MRPEPHQQPIEPPLAGHGKHDVDRIERMRSSADDRLDDIDGILLDNPLGRRRKTESCSRQVDIGEERIRSTGIRVEWMRCAGPRHRLDAVDAKRSAFTRAIIVGKQVPVP